jgi:hypothetical protein
MQHVRAEENRRVIQQFLQCISHKKKLRDLNAHIQNIENNLNIFREHEACVVNELLAELRVRFINRVKYITCREAKLNKKKYKYIAGLSSMIQEYYS